MTKKKWTREMYMQLEHMDCETPFEELAKVFETDKKDIPYRIRMIKQKTDILTWTIDELIRLERSMNMDVFLTYCREVYPRRDINIGIDHWVNRSKYLAKWYKEQKKNKTNHTITIKRKVRTEPAVQRPDPPIIDEKDLNREILTVLQDIKLIITDTYTLFEKLANKQREEAK